jgi:hypothetical protein
MVVPVSSASPSCYRIICAAASDKDFDFNQRKFPVGKDIKVNSIVEKKMLHSWRFKHKGVVADTIRVDQRLLGCSQDRFKAEEKRKDRSYKDDESPGLLFVGYFVLHRFINDC